MNSFGPSLTLSVETNSSADISVQNRNMDLGYLNSDEDFAQEADFVYDPSRDVIVFLHMQKTSGSTFGRQLVRSAVGFPAACIRLRGRKRRNCTDSKGLQWLFSRHSMGWACGLHADWTELHACVPRALNKIEGGRRKRRSVEYFILIGASVCLFHLCLHTVSGDDTIKSFGCMSCHCICFTALQFTASLC